MLQPQQLRAILESDLALINKELSSCAARTRTIKGLIDGRLARAEVAAVAPPTQADNVVSPEWIPKVGGAVDGLFDHAWHRAEVKKLNYRHAKAVILWDEDGTQSKLDYKDLRLHNPRGAKSHAALQGYKVMKTIDGIRKEGKVVLFDETTECFTVAYMDNTAEMMEFYSLKPCMDGYTTSQAEEAEGVVPMVEEP